MKQEDKIFLTQLRAIDPGDGLLKTWAGPEIPAASWEEAEQYCRENMGFLSVIGEGIGQDEAWAGGPVQCPLCAHEWVSVRPATTERLECPNCENMVEPIEK